MRQLCLFSFALTLLVVLLGAYTRLTDAGLGCPDWPGCYGFNYVPDTASEQQLAASRFPDNPLDLAKAGNEMLHRYAAGSLGMIILVLALCSLRARHRTYRMGAWLLLALVIVQATLGMLTVTLNLLPFIVLGHLLGGFSILALLFLLLLRARSRAVQDGEPRARLHTLQYSRQHPQQYSQQQSQQRSHPQYARQLLALWWLALLVLIIQIALGGWTAANYAALACVELPVCQGDWLSQWQWSAFHPHGMPAASYQYGVLSSDERITIHVAHRLWAMVTTVVLFTLAWRCYQVRELQFWAAWLALAVVMQLALGVANVWWHLPLPLAVAHNAGAAFLLLIVTGTGERLSRAREAIWRETRHLSAIKQ